MIDFKKYQSEQHFHKQCNFLVAFMIAIAMATLITGIIYNLV